MIHLRIFVLFIFVFRCTFLNAQNQVKVSSVIPSDFCINQAEMQLYKMINDYRKRYELTAVPLSRSLCYVASSHAKDLFFNHPDQEPCTSYSWSDKGPWKSFCYPRDENKKNSVWNKPKEFTPYPGKGYEIVYWENSTAIPDSIISEWKSIDYTRNFLLNSGKWVGKKWNAIGIGIYENYACAWFGEMNDPAGTAVYCGNLSVQGSDDSIKQSKKEKKSVNLSEGKKENKPEIKIEPTQAGTGMYYIIIRSNIPLETASKMIPKLVTEGFPSAKVLEKEGKARISVFESSNKTETMNKLKEIKKKFKDAWLLKK